MKNIIAAVLVALALGLVPASAQANPGGVPNHIPCKPHPDYPFICEVPGLPHRGGKGH